jgi:hypothetical protein
METIQIELTSACVKRCSNCTRFSGTKQKEFFIEESDFHAAIDSLVEYSKQPHAMVGFMGGDPLLHPKFLEFCDYAASKIDRYKLGLWSTFPDGPKYKAYAETICRTFGNVLLNDHSRNDILHAPVLMASEEYFRKPCERCSGTGKCALNISTREDETIMRDACDCPDCKGKGSVTDDLSLFTAVDNCWVQATWSASINPKGAWFCEVAAALSDLFDGPEGWKVEPGWWKRTPKDFKEQMDWACRKCGAALPLERIRNSQDNRDDVSPGNLERLKAIKSRKVARGEYEVREEFKFDQKLIEGGTYPAQTYKDHDYRRRIAARYGIMLTMNQRGYWEPNMAPPGYTPPGPPPMPLFHIMEKRYSEPTASKPQGD